MKVACDPIGLEQIMKKRLKMNLLMAAKCTMDWDKFSWPLTKRFLR